MYYALILFKALGQNYDTSFILSGMVNLVQLIAGIPILFYLNQVGRRRLAPIGDFAMLSLITLRSCSVRSGIDLYDFFLILSDFCMPRFVL